MQFSAAPLPQIQPFQPPNLAGIANTMQEQSLNAMRERQLMGAEKENMDLRRLMADPTFDPTAPGAMNRILSVAPRSGAQTYQALMAAQRERRQAEGAGLENAAKLTLAFRNMLPAVNAENYPTVRAAAVAAVPQWAAVWPETYSADAVRGLMEKAEDSLKQYGVNVTALPGGQGFVAAPQVMPRGAAPLQGPTFYPAESIPAAPPPPAPGAPAPRAEAPGLTPAQLQAAHMLRGFEGFEGTPYFDRTAFRAGFGSDQTTRADGTFVPVQQGMIISREDAERDLARRIPEFTRRAERNIGAENFARLPPNAQAALISIAYNYGHIPESLLPAARSGDLTALSQAVAALPDNPSRRQSEAAVIAGQGPRLVQANAMVPGAAPANAMLAPANAMVRSDVPQLPLDPSAGPLARADYQKRMLDAIQQLEVKRIEAERARTARREDAAAIAAEEAEKAGGVAQAQAEVRGRLPPPPAGQRYNAEGRLEDIPGSERERAAAERRGAQVKAATVVTESIDRILDRLNTSLLPVTGFGAPTMAALMSGSPAADVGELRKTIEGNISFESLTEMRRQSPTGGALGNVTDKDLELLKTSLGSLNQNQSPRQFRENLIKLRDRFLETIHGPNFRDVAPPPPQEPAPERLPGRRGAPPTGNRPTLEQFLDRARQEPRNANVSIEDLTAYYNRTYGGR